MLNINELESRWLRYKIKSYLPYAIILLSFFVVGMIFMYTNVNTSQVAKKSVQEHNTSIQKEEKVTPKVTVKKQVTKNNIVIEEEKTTQKSTNKITMQPSLNFMNNIKTNSPAYYKEERATKKTTTYEKPIAKPEPIKEKVIKEVVVVEEPKVEVVNEAVINIKRQNTQDDINHVIQRFKKSNNPTLSLFIAKKYYELQNYTEAYNYALITNSINNSIEESWILFAKSLVKLSKKDKAIEVLKKYITSSNSQRAKLLLDKIKSGKFQ